MSLLPYLFFFLAYKRVSAVNGAEWLQSLTEPPLLQYSPAAQFLNSYFPDGVGLSPTLNNWKQDVEDTTGTILFNRKKLGHGFESHWSPKMFFRVDLQLFKLQLPLQQSYLLWRSSVVEYSSDIKTSALIKYDNVSTQGMWDCFTTQKTLKQHLPSALTLWNQKRKKLSQNFSGILHQLYQNNAYFNLYFESQVIHDMLKLTCY